MIRDIPHQTVIKTTDNHQPIQSHKHESLSIGTRICASLKKNSQDDYSVWLLLFLLAVVH